MGKTGEVQLSDNELWLLSFYRSSEISGALFFGRLARILKPGPIQADMTKHFADESQHSWFWTECINRLGCDPLRLNQAYQDQYIMAAGMPANIMEVLAITQVFEKRVIGQYALHAQVPETHPVVRATIQKIMEDEKWHIQWVNQALERFEPEFGREHIQNTLKRFREADRQVYQKTVGEHEERIRGLIKTSNGQAVQKGNDS